MELTDEQKTTIRRIAVEAANTITKNWEYLSTTEFTDLVDFIYDYIVTGEYKPRNRNQLQDL